MSDNIPTATHSGILHLCGVDLHVYRLDNGTIIIDAKDLEAFFEALGSGEIIEHEESLELAKMYRGMGLAKIEDNV